MRAQGFAAGSAAGRSLLLFAILSLGSPAQAQMSPTPPTPGSVGDTLKPRPELKPPPQAPIEDRATEATPDRQPAGGPTMVVKTFEFDGNTLFSDQTLAALVASYRNRPVSLYELFEAADTIAAHYVERGYTLASVTIPPQRVERGTVVFEVIEGRVARIRADGTRRYREEHLRAYLSEVRPGQIYESRELSQGLRQLNELPGLSARAVIEPGPYYGSSDIVLRAEETPVAGALFVDNHGRDTIGEFRAAASLELNNPTRTEDQLRLLALVSDHALLQYGQIEYSVPLNFRGPRLALSYGQADFEVGEGPFEDLVEGTNRNARAGLVWPLILERNQRLTLLPAVRGTDADTDQFGLVERGTRIALLDIGALYSRVFVNRSMLQLSGGISSDFSAQSRADLLPLDAVGRDQRFRAEIDVQQLTPLGQHCFVYARLNGVWSPDPLVDTEQFSLGGPSSVRGYPAAEVRGDRGYLTTIGLNRHFPFGALALDGRLFVDAGSAWTIDPPPGTDKRSSLASVGLGADLSMPAGLMLRLDLAHPFGDQADEISDGRDDLRVFGTLSYRF